MLAAVLGPAQLVPPQNAQEAFGVGAAVYGSLLLHEAGHIAACARLGLRHGGIGFGFYAYVFPVLFADITGIWQATKQQRVIGNLAGIFMQLLLATGLTTAYLLQPYAPLLLASTGIALTAVWQLNPFVRRDGYWLLSDLTNTPNLSEQAAQARQELLRGQRWTARRLVLGIYGLLNGLAFGALLLYLLFLHGPAMLELPAALPALLGELPVRWPHLTHSQLVALGCYLVWLRVGVATLVQRKRKP
ncbi:hypothetical protein LRS06_21910 [Hymenobacter sp. J193]|uniref:hypothetical protein n=1 Tax=Hymenobacter sp. J193 TaxID=2898429 RepID=UPI0021507AF0|nr:hypothetical protein [Hymenobacter sp. J193]MCR5890387.1 hypothetical protein [Hymenobacter sp. J193]